MKKANLLQLNMVHFCFLACLSIDERRTNSQVYTLMLGLRNTSVYCSMGDFGWTPVMKTNGTKVKEVKFSGRLLFSSQKMVSFYFFVNFSNLLQVYFYVFAFSLWKMVS